MATPTFSSAFDRGAGGCVCVSHLQVRTRVIGTRQSLRQRMMASAWGPIDGDAESDDHSYVLTVTGRRCCRARAASGRAPSAGRGAGW